MGGQGAGPVTTHLARAARWEEDDDEAAEGAARGAPARLLRERRGLRDSATRASREERATAGRRPEASSRSAAAGGSRSSASATGGRSTSIASSSAAAAAIGLPLRGLGDARAGQALNLPASCPRGSHWPPGRRAKAEFDFYWTEVLNTEALHWASPTATLPGAEQGGGGGERKGSLEDARARFEGGRRGYFF